MTFDFGVAFDLGAGIVDEGKVAIGEFDGPLYFMPLPVAMVDPLPPFTRMAKATPFGQFPEQFLVQQVEDNFS